MILLLKEFIAVISLVKKEDYSYQKQSGVNSVHSYCKLESGKRENEEEKEVPLKKKKEKPYSRRRMRRRRGKTV